jgi:UDP-glucuronate 4-epimerase
MRIFVTGTAGFIGMHLARRLLDDGHQVMGYDGMTPYYNVELKRRRHALLERCDKFSSVEGMLEDQAALNHTISTFSPEVIVHLAAQAGVRYSLESPKSYISSNIVGTFNLLEAAHDLKLRHLLVASTSSVYGGNERMPFEESDRTDFPLSHYAATKKACEVMSHSFAHLFKIPTTCFRFFTVYGPWGRPDMALFKFVSAIMKGEPIEVYGHGEMKRDFTYIDDLVEGIVRLIGVVPGEAKPAVVDTVGDSLSPVAPWRVVNIGGGEPVRLMSFIETIETILDRKAIKTMLPIQKGDVAATSADARLLQALTGFTPTTSIFTGVRSFVDWYQQDYTHD